MTFNPGDIVRLKSGSPEMVVRFTVDSLASNATGREIGVWVDWIVGGYRQSSSFGEEQLEKTEQKRKRQK